MWLVTIKIITSLIKEAHAHLRVFRDRDFLLTLRKLQECVLIVWAKHKYLTTLMLAQGKQTLSNSMQHFKANFDFIA